MNYFPLFGGNGTSNFKPTTRQAPARAATTTMSTPMKPPDSRTTSHTAGARLPQTTSSTPATHGVVSSAGTRGLHVGGRRGFPPFKQSAREPAGKLDTRAERTSDDKHVQQLTTASPNKRVGCLITRSVVSTEFNLMINSRKRTRNRHV